MARLLLRSHFPAIANQRMIEKTTSPEKQVIAENFSQKLCEFFHENPISSSISILSGIGGIIIFSHFLQIGRMPELDLAGSASLLIHSALAGILVTTVIVVLLTIPGWYLIQLKKDGLLPDLSVDECINKNDAADKSPRRAAAKLTLLTAILSAIIQFTLIYCDQSTASVIILIISVLVIQIHIWFSAYLKEIIASYSQIKKDNISRALIFSIYLAWWPLSALLWKFVDADGNMPEWPPILLMSTIAALWHFVIYASSSAPTKLRIKMSALLLSLLVLTSNMVGPVISATIRSLGLGMVPSVRLQLDSEGCAIIKHWSNGASVIKSHPIAIDTTQMGCVIPDVFLVSRIGKDFLITTLPPTQQKKSDVARPAPNIRGAISIGHQHVLSWSRNTTDVTAAHGKAK